MRRARTGGAGECNNKHSWHVQACRECWTEHRAVRDVCTCLLTLLTAVTTGGSGAAAGASAIVPGLGCTMLALRGGAQVW